MANDTTKSKWTIKHIALVAASAVLIGLAYLFGATQSYTDSIKIVADGDVSKAGETLEGIPDDAKLPFSKTEKTTVTPGGTTTTTTTTTPHAESGVSAPE